MLMHDILDQLVHVSQVLGQNVAFVQGGGGNTSAKVFDGSLLVKASGFELRRVTRDDGLARIPLAPFLDLIREAQLTDDALTARSVSMSLNGRRPSIEAGLHAILPAPLVVHTHNVYLNVVNCSERGASHVERLLGHQALWVPFVKPGLELVRKVTSLVANRPEVRCLFLQNHGFVTWGNQGESVVEYHQHVTDLVRTALDLPDFCVRTEVEADELPGVLFPDQVVYGRERSLGMAYRETVSACWYLEQQLLRLGERPSYIAETQQKEIAGMDSEKYRKALGSSDADR